MNDVKKKKVNKRIFLICIVATGLCGCATTNTSMIAITAEKPSLTLSQKEAWSMVVGKWYGSQPTKNGGKKEEIHENLPDGTYKVTFRVIDPEKVAKESVEVGQWGVCGPIYFSIFRGWVRGDRFSPSNPSDPYNYDAYRIIKLGNEVFEYEHVTTGNHYVIRKVPLDFKFPE